MKIHTQKFLQHPFDPIYDATSKTLILGTFPSVKSRENAFYYGHPQNRFWPLLAQIFTVATPVSIEEKIAFLSRYHIALWDVLAGCAIQGSADSSITKAVANDITPLLKNSQISKIYTNGQKAQSLYERFMYPHTGLKATVLPSTSPANRRFSHAEMLRHWQQIREI